MADGAMKDNPEMPTAIYLFADTEIAAGQEIIILASAIPNTEQQITKEQQIATASQ